MEERHEQLAQDWERLQAHILDKQYEMTVIQDRVKKLRTLDARLAPLVNSVLDLIKAP